ncbi:hypothetical protein DFJ77DRAFT_455391 [Powellomyces hirtus]|nr:hypothetical protein DFJ77DRAFT_455391 [Powellomyces hirtus]
MRKRQPLSAQMGRVFELARGSLSIVLCCVEFCGAWTLVKNNIAGDKRQMQSAQDIIDRRPVVQRNVSRFTPNIYQSSTEGRERRSHVPPRSLMAFHQGLNVPTQKYMADLGGIP